LINKYLKSLKLSSYAYDIEEIDLAKELLIINEHILENYLQGSSNPDDEKQTYIKRLHGWRIQEYISLAANYEKEGGRWTTSIVNNNESLTSIFVLIKKHLIVINFLIRPNSDYLIVSRMDKRSASIKSNNERGL